MFIWMGFNNTGIREITRAVTQSASLGDLKTFSIFLTQHSGVNDFNLTFVRTIMVLPIKTLRQNFVTAPVYSGTTRLPRPA